MKGTAENSSTNFSWLQVPKSIWYFLEKDKRRYLVLNTVLFGVLFYGIVPPLIFGNIVDFFAGYTVGEPLRPFYLSAIVLGVSYAVVSYIRLFCKNALSKIAIAARTRARVYGFERLVNLPLQWHAQQDTGNKIEKIFTGSQSIREWVSVSNNGIFPIAVSFISVLLVFLFLSPIFVLFLSMYLILFFGIEAYFNRKISALSDAINIAKQQASGRYIEGGGNILAIKALGAERGVSAHVQRTEEETQKLLLARTSAGTRKWYFFQTLNGASFTLFALLIGFQVIGGLMTLGTILVFFSYFARLRDAADDATEISSRVIEMKSDLAAMMPIFTETANVQTGHEPFPQPHDMGIHDGSFSYPSGQTGLRRLHFSLQKQEKVGVAGPSGSGKSTLVKILLGLYPLTGGEFTVGGKPYDTIDHKEVIRNIAVVLQETELFNLSLQDNITLMRDLDEQKLAEAIDIAQLKTVVDQLPNGLRTLIGERGYKLSGGERQRLGIARAIYKNAPIMILDEATSSLDSQTEKNVLDVLLRTFAREKTVLIIAHRIATLQKTDRVVFFEQGTIVEEGTFRKLIDDPTSRLGRLHTLQRSGKEG